MVIARVQRYWARGSSLSPGIDAPASAGVAPSGQVSTSQQRSDEKAVKPSMTSLT
jgi:hypothetical protein